MRHDMSSHAARYELACGKCRGVNLTGLRPGPFIPVFLYWFLYPSLFMIRHLDVPGP